MDESERTAKLRRIRDEVVGFAESPLYEERQLPVIWEGSHTAFLLCVGEAPGRNEAKTGRPFCGSAGVVLDGLFASAGLERKEAYVTNIVKDHLPMNRDPLPDEIAAYASFLDRQIESIQPRFWCHWEGFHGVYHAKVRIGG